MQAHGLLSCMVADVWKAPRHTVVIHSEASGRPYLVQAGARRLPFISLSHSRGWIACAATEVGPIGIDIEHPRPRRDLHGIAASAFGPQEQARVTAAGDHAFYRIWTLREAIAKACGRGLALAADGRDRVHEGPDEGDWMTTLEGTAWALSHRLIGPDLSFATAVMLNHPGQRVRHVHWAGDLTIRR